MGFRASLQEASAHPLDPKKMSDKHVEIVHFLEALYTFKDGDNVTKLAGQRTWDMMHTAADSYPCPPCKEPFQVLVSLMHDVVNVHLKKPIHDPKRFEKGLSMIQEATPKVRHVMIER